MAFDQQIAEID